MNLYLLKIDSVNEFSKKVFKEHAFALAFWVAGFVFAIFNLYIIDQLAPLNQNLTILATKVDAIELKDNNFVSQDQLSQIDQRLESIQNTLNVLVSK